MLKNTEAPNHPTFGPRPDLPPILAVDSRTNTVYDVATFIQELNHPNYQGLEDLATKLDLFAQITITWADETAQVSTIREMMMTLFRMRDAVAGIKVNCS